jgi:hypothetical protein
VSNYAVRGKSAEDRLIALWRDSTAEYRAAQLSTMNEILNDPRARNGEHPYDGDFSYDKFKATVAWLDSWHKTLLDKE